jgi:hypothetical protein
MCVRHTADERKRVNLATEPLRKYEEYDYVTRTMRAIQPMAESTSATSQRTRVEHMANWVDQVLNARRAANAAHVFIADVPQLGMCAYPYPIESVYRFISPPLT